MPLRKPVADRLDERTSLFPLAPGVQKPAKARDGSQFPGTSFLASGDCEGLFEARLGRAEGVLCRVDEQ